MGVRRQEAKARARARRCLACRRHVDLRAIDAETKLVPSFLVGKRDQAHTDLFIADVAKRLRDRVQISTDGLRTYIDAIGRSFGGRVDMAQVVKSYEGEPIGPGRYSPPKVTGVTKTPIYGEPVEAYVSTSIAERMNLSIRTMGRRYTRLTNAFSKKLEQHVASTALILAHYNFVRQHKTLRTSPAMAAGVCSTLWSTEELVSAALDGVRA
jgi:IS1 family transposase